MTKLKKHKRLIVFFLTITLIVIASFARLRYINKSNHRYTKNMTYDKSLGKAKYIKEQNGYVYKFKVYSFFNSDVFLSVTKKEDTIIRINDSGERINNEPQIIFFVWPDKKEYTYGVDITWFDHNDEEVESQFYVDDNCEIIQSDIQYSENEIDIYNNNKQKISDLLASAKEFWGL